MSYPDIDQFLELKIPRKVTWRELLYIERPQYAIRTIERVHGHHFFHLKGLQELRRGEPRIGIRPAGPYADIKTLLDTCQVVLINRKTKFPAFESVEITEDHIAKWTLSPWLKSMASSRLDYMMRIFKVPEIYTPVRYVEAAEPEQIQQQTPAEKPRSERHMVQLELEGENGSALPDKKHITIFVQNVTQGTSPVEQRREIIYTPESRVFKANSGDELKIYAIDQKMKDVQQDLRRNGNVKQSEADGLIKPLEIINVDKTANDITLHIAKYIVPEERNITVDYEYGRPNNNPSSDLLCLNHNESDWQQKVWIAKQASQVEKPNDGWLQITFRDLPKDGTFSLYKQNQINRSSPIELFSNQAYEDLSINEDLEALNTIEKNIAELTNKEQVEKNHTHINWAESLLN